MATVRRYANDPLPWIGPSRQGEDGRAPAQGIATLPVLADPLTAVRTLAPHICLLSAMGCASYERTAP
jgi:hypothetical protein